MKNLTKVLMLTAVLFALTSAPTMVEPTEGLGGVVESVVNARPTADLADEWCLMCYEGYHNGWQVHVFDDWDGYEAAFKAGENVHVFTAKQGSCGEPFDHVHTCCEEEGGEGEH